MRFLIDAQLPTALARWLAAKGYEAEHVADRQMGSATDGAIWDLAIQIAAVIITKDEDFAQRKALIDAGPTVIWIRLPNTRRQELLAWFETVLPDILLALERGEKLIEVV
jgi:predicted nuclease of predicted toxin-antitoxin system